MLICPCCLSLGFVQMFKDIWSDATMMSVVFTICAEYRYFAYSECYMYNMCEVWVTISRNCFLQHYYFRVTQRVCQQWLRYVLSGEDFT